MSRVVLKVGCSQGRSALTQCNYLHFWVNYFLLGVQMEKLWRALAICLLGKEEAMSLEVFAEVDVRRRRVSMLIQWLADTV